MLGGALLVAVIAAALHFSEERAFVRVVQEAEPWWLAVAVFLQVGTYVAQGASGGSWLARPNAPCHDVQQLNSVWQSFSLIRPFHRPD